MSLPACRVKGAAQCSSAGVSLASLVVPCLADPDVHLLVSLARAGPLPSSALPRSSCIGLPSTSSAECGKAGDRCACTTDSVVGVRDRIVASGSCSSPSPGEQGSERSATSRGGGDGDGDGTSTI
jgi:hypothetical protein